MRTPFANPRRWAVGASSRGPTKSLLSFEIDRLAPESQMTLRSFCFSVSVYSGTAAKDFWIHSGIAAKSASDMDSKRAGP
jgi:hypothetical protein